MVKAIHDEPGGFIGFAKVTRDLTEKKNAEQEAFYHAAHDILSGELNRRGFVDALDHRLKRFCRLSPTAILSIDLDYFKPVNDSFDHPTGDQVLREASQRLQMAIGDHGAVGRLWGDEFAVFTYDLADDFVTDKATEIANALSRSIHVGEQIFKIGASDGDMPQACIVPLHCAPAAAALRPDVVSRTVVRP